MASSSSSHVVLKTAFRGDLRRFSIQRHAPPSFADLVAKLQNDLYVDALPRGAAVRLRYRDEDGDIITVAGDSDLRECLATALPAGGGALKLEVVVAGSAAPGSAPQGSCVAVHRGVICDGCEMSPIRGPRFKSLTKPDFDLCGACKDSGKYEDTYQRIEKRTCPVSEDAAKFRKFWSGNCADAAAKGCCPKKNFFHCLQPWMLKKMLGAERFPEAEIFKCFENLSKMRANASNCEKPQKSETESEPQAMDWNRMEEFLTPLIFQFQERFPGIDLSQLFEIVRSLMQDVQEGKRDLGEVVAEVLHSFQDRKDSEGSRDASENTDTDRFGAELVCDVTIPEGTVVPSGQTFTKTWKLRNSASVAWPGSTCVALLAESNGEDIFGVSSEKGLGIDEKGVPAGSEFDVSIEMKAPSQPGNYEAYYKLAVPGVADATTKQHVFGETLCVKILVEEAPAVEAPAAKSDAHLLSSGMAHPSGILNSSISGNSSSFDIEESSDQEDEVVTKGDFDAETSEMSKPSSPAWVKVESGTTNDHVVLQELSRLVRSGSIDVGSIQELLSKQGS